MADQFESIKAWFDSLPGRFQGSRAGSMDAVFQYDISGEGGGQWFLTIKDKAITVNEGLAPNPRLTIIVSAEDYLRVVNRKADPVSLYEMGRVRLIGSEYLAEQLMYLLG
jgi:putative sterol carrier protein